MKWSESIKRGVKGMGFSIGRFPLTTFMLLLVALLNGMMIEDSDLDFMRLIYTFVVGAMLSVVAQMIYERFYQTETIRYALMGGAVGLTLLYYFLVGPQVAFDWILMIKTTVVLFALVIAFIWVPSIQNEAVPFHRSFLSAVKAFFTAVLFTIVLAAGFSAIYGAITTLLFEMDSDILGHIINIVLSLFAPIYFLSLTPNYPGVQNDVVGDDEALAVPRFLEVLISYIVIPLVVIYTLILILYVLLNVTGDFWTDNLLEPLLVSYAIIGIIVLILSYNIENRFAVLFRQIFPKVLLPIVVFQTIASILKIGEMGITHGRYYVIMFGLFATIAAFVFSFLKVKHHGIIAVVILVLTTVSIIPPIDAFTLSKNNQISLLEDTLRENNMLENDEVIPKEDVPVEDRMVITKTATYIEDMGYNNEVDFVPNGYYAYTTFGRVFGFNPTYSETDEYRPSEQYLYLENTNDFLFDIAMYDVMFSLYLSESDGDAESFFDPYSFEVDGESYEVTAEFVSNQYWLVLSNGSGGELIQIKVQDLYDEMFSENRLDQGLTIENARFTEENDRAEMTILVKNIQQSDSYESVEFYLFVQVK